MGNRRTHAFRRDQAERLKRALEMKQAGASHAEIARVLGYKSEHTVDEVLRRGLAKIPSHAAKEYRNLQTLRLEEMWVIAHDKLVTDRSMWALDRCIQIHDRIARLHGLEAPQKVAIGVITAESLEAANNAMEAQLRALPVEDQQALGLPAPGSNGQSVIETNGHPVEGNGHA